MNVIAVLLVALLATILRSALLMGEENPEGKPERDAPYSLSEIVVTADPFLPARSATLREINREEIESLDVRNAGEAMEYSSSVYFSRNSRSESTFRLRGFSQRQVSVFLDGVPVSVPFDGVVDLSQFAGDNLEMVQITKGVPSVLYGANALGGTVNLITTPPGDRPEARVRVEGSDQGRLFSNLNLRGGLCKLRVSGWGSFEKAPNFGLPGDFDPLPNESGGHRDHSAFEKRSGGLKVLVPLNAANRVAVHVNYIDNEYDIPPNASVAKPRYWRFPEWRRGVVSLNSEHDLGHSLGLRTVWFYDRYDNVLKSYDDATYTTQKRPYAFDSTFHDESLGVILYPEARFLSWGPTSGLFSYKRDVHRQKDDEGPWARYAMETYTMALEQEAELVDGLSAAAGADASYLRPTDAEGSPLRDPIFLANGQAVLSFAVAKAVAVHCGFGKKSRFPTLKEIYSERLGKNIANPDLKAEHSWNVEAGVRLSGRIGRLQATFFQNRLRDLIVNRQLGKDVQQLQNIGEARIWGLELEGQGNWERLSWSWNYTLLRAEDRSSDRESRFLEYRPKHRVNTVVGYRVLNPLTFQAELSYTAGQQYRNPDTLEFEPLNDFFVANLKAGYEFREGLDLYLRLDNVTDNSYVSEYGVPMPGREVTGGVRLRF